VTIHIADIWRDVGRRIGFYTKETRGLIPEASGCYAWFIPLWIFSEDLQSFLDTINKALLYDPHNEGTPERLVRADFNWDSVDLTMRKRGDIRPTQAKLSDWKRAMEHADARDGFQQALMEASLFMPPLYVGKADNLRERYLQHVQGAGGADLNTFHSRFSRYAERAELRLAVSDLLFVCIQTPAELAAIFREQNLNELLEQILMRLCRPTFSIR